MPASHTGDAIFQALRKVLTRFGIYNHIIAITSDSADTNRVCCEILEKWLHRRNIKQKAEDATEEEEDHLKDAPEAYSAKKGWMSCLAHGANRAVQDILKTLKVSAPTAKDRDEQLYSQVTEHTFIGTTHETTMKKIRRIIVKYKRSELFREALDKQCVTYELEPLALILDMEVGFLSLLINHYTNIYNVLYQYPAHISTLRTFSLPYHFEVR